MSKIYLEVNGVKYDGFKQIGYFKSIEAASGTFGFVASSSGKRYLPFKGNTKCRILYGTKPLITGYIENPSYSYNEAGHTVSGSGRDKTCDIIDSTVKGNVDFKAPISLKTICENVISLLGHSAKVINSVPDLKDFTENEIAVAEVGENAFDFLEKYCRKRGCLLTSDGDGNIVIAQAGLERLSGILLSQINGNNNNIKGASISYDFTERYNQYVVRSQGNPSIAALLDDDGEGMASVEGTKGEAFDDELRSSRYLEIKSESVAVDETAEQRAKWEANIRRARSKVYTCQLRSLLTNEGAIYEPNKLIRVRDDFCDIDAIMLIRSVDYSLDEGSGTSVSLELVPRDAYTLQASRDALDSKHNKVGVNVV